MDLFVCLFHGWWQEGSAESCHPALTCDFCLYHSYYITLAGNDRFRLHTKIRGKTANLYAIRKCNALPQPGFELATSWLQSGRAIDWAITSLSIRLYKYYSTHRLMQRRIGRVSTRTQFIGYCKRDSRRVCIKRSLLYRIFRCHQYAV